MEAKDKTSLESLEKLRSKRDEAADHLLRTQRAQETENPFLPALAHTIIIELADVIERLNDEIFELEDAINGYKRLRYIQPAFTFLYECAISEGEIPF